jgi:hypothetical protein
MACYVVAARVAAALSITAELWENAVLAELNSSKKVKR